MDPGLRGDRGSAGVAARAVVGSGVASARFEAEQVRQGLTQRVAAHPRGRVAAAAPLDALARAGVVLVLLGQHHLERHSLERPVAIAVHTVSYTHLTLPTNREVY